MRIAGGTIGVTHCPGLHGDFEADLDALRAWNADAVLTLLRNEELERMGVTTLGDELSKRGIAWIRLPVHDLAAPRDAFHEAWRDVSHRVRASLATGGRVAVHCRNGFGRAGNVTAMLLIDAGLTADEAIAQVREHRPGAIADPEDEILLRAHAARTSDTHLA